MKMPLWIVAVCVAVAMPRAASAHLITLTGTVRDFNDTHPDFEDGGGSDPGIVLPVLGGDDKPVYAGLAGNPTTHGKDAFDQWYRDTAGVNMSAPLSITLSNGAVDPGGVYTYSNGSFFPIDGMLLGNQGRGHNYHFTYELHTLFTYKTGQTFSFTGDDDLFVFIDDSLVIDLGGVHGAMGATVSLDTLGLTDGTDYTFDLFFAERHTVASTFAISTSIQLRTAPTEVPEPATLTLLGAGLMALRRKRHT